MEPAKFSTGHARETVPATASGAAIAAIMDQIASGVIFVDGNGRISLINRRAEEMLQVETSSIIGKMIHMLPLRTAIYKVLSEDCREGAVEFSINGTIINARSVELGAPGDEVVGELYELRDITEEKREKRQREEIVAMMTHDLKSPLTVLMGYIQSMRTEALRKQDEPAIACLEEMDRSANRLLTMIEDVLDVYRLEAGLLRIDCSQCDIATVVDRCCRDAEREAAARGSDFSCLIEEGLPQLCADGKQLARVFANLIGNALKFTPRRGSVMVTAGEDHGNLAISVRDTGIGIPEQDLPKIFNKYYRSTIATGFKGTGLGLTISKAIVEAHGGTIEVDSTEGEGSCFTVILPCIGKRRTASGN